jgi:predicted dehydrogenase
VSLVGSNTVPNGCGHSLSFHGSRGSLFVENPGADVVRPFRLSVADDGGHRTVLYESEHLDLDQSLDTRVVPSRAIASRFVEAFNGGQPKEPFPTVRDASRVVLLIEAICKSNISQRSICIDEFAH